MRAIPLWAACLSLIGAAIGPRVAEAQAAGLCQGAISAAEAGARVPEDFLAAIARVESGRADPSTGLRDPWPWTVNAEGVGSFYPTKALAVAAVRALQSRGVKSIDIGCLQINLMHHPDAFANLEQGFDPESNASYAAEFLLSLHDRMGSWPLAAAAYHSQTPTLGSAYQKRVLAEWAIPQAGQRVPRPGRADAATLTARNNGPAAPEPSAHTPMAPAGRMAGLVQPSRFVRPPGVVGRSLAAYRQLPVRMALQGPRLQ